MEATATIWHDRETGIAFLVLCDAQGCRTTDCAVSFTVALQSAMRHIARGARLRFEWIEQQEMAR
jgi:hypothetical protein